MKKTLAIIVILLSFIIMTMEMTTMYALEMTYTPSEPYKKSLYYTKLKNVELNGNYHEDIAKVALSQVGYHEGNSEKELNGGNSYGNGNYSEYGYWYGLQADWCAMFVSWCARQARIPKDVIGNSTFATTGDFGLEFRWKKDYTPVVGDIIIFDYAPYNMIDPGEHGDHVGLVVGVDDKKVYTVEGNAGNAVCYKSYDIDYSEIKGYGIYDEPEKKEISASDETSEEPSEESENINIPEESEERSEISEESAADDNESITTGEGSTDEKGSFRKTAIIIGCAAAAVCAAVAAVVVLKHRRK